ncbi:MAG: hypothetical protein Q9159_001653 [Coniocarpon cinnabarinum]
MVTTRSQIKSTNSTLTQATHSLLPKSRVSKPEPSSRSNIIKKPPQHHYRQPISPNHFGLIQERYQHSLYALLVQAILWNQTAGRAARPVLEALLSRYPDPPALAAASRSDLVDLLYPIGLHNQRAARLINFGSAWVASPPCKARRYVRRDYPNKGDGRAAKVGEVLGEDDEREGWEVAHLPGMGPYALDSYRIFYRDRLRDVENEEGVGEEWKRVTAGDKDLRAWLVWRWNREGMKYDPQKCKVIGPAEQRD